MCLLCEDLQEDDSDRPDLGLSSLVASCIGEVGRGHGGDVKRGDGGEGGLRKT